MEYFRCTCENGHKLDWKLAELNKINAEIVSIEVVNRVEPKHSSGTIYLTYEIVYMVKSNL